MLSNLVFSFSVYLWPKFLKRTYTNPPPSTYLHVHISHENPPSGGGFIDRCGGEKYCEGVGNGKRRVEKVGGGYIRVEVGSDGLRWEGRK